MPNQPLEYFFNSNIELMLYYCGRENCSPNHSWGPDIKNKYKIHYVHSGRGVFQTKNKTYTLEQGQGFLICPETISYYKADDIEPWSYSWVEFNGHHAESLLKQAHLSEENPIFTCNKNQQHYIENCLDEMVGVNKENKDIRLVSMLYSFLGIIIDSVNSKDYPKETGNLKQLYVEKALRFIETNFSKPITIENISQEANLSRKYLSRIFKDATSLTLQEYLIQYRMNKACELLITTSLSIGEISNSVGYKNQLQFSRIFKKVTSYSPSLYRNTFQ